MPGAEPSDVRWESWVDRQIREAQERGEFDDLPGAGKPLPDLDRPRDDLWWVKRLVRREGISLTPPALALRKEVEEARRKVEAAGSEAEVRRIVSAVNARIVAVNRQAISGPPSTVAPLDADEMVRAWRRRQDGPGGSGARACVHDWDD